MENEIKIKSKGTSVLGNSLVWFGAGISIAEIITGTYLASLGFGRGLAAIILGHVIGCVMMFSVGIIGGKTRKSAMQTVKMSFGEYGGKFFALLNILQLVGWTAIMIYDGALAANGVFAAGLWVWALLIGALIIVWLLIGIRNISKISAVAVGGLFILSLVLCKVIFSGGMGTVPEPDGLTFGAAVELGVAMPLSWLPLISDYTKDAEKPFAATLGSVITYGIVSTFMYVIGMGAVLFTGEYDISLIMLKAGLGIAALLIIVFSTVTTTFLDAYSAGVSSVSLSPGLSDKKTAIFVTIIGTAAAIVYPMDNITNFLYMIGSVFAPMAAVMLANYFILRRNLEKSKISIISMAEWLLGFIIYRLLMHVDTVVGNTLPDMVITIIICVIVGQFVKSGSYGKDAVHAAEETK
ncbi:MAG: putative hydroxymethylpyrimidine transporter CytX [Clostridia bacterium]|nr:putative hydroxymethylpyrimidine transporter CytX [Clostridia bacterium]